MPDGDLGSSHVAFNNDTRVWVATTIAALVFAGSAFLWRSGSPLPRRILALRQSAEGSSLVSDCKLPMKSDSSENHQISVTSNKSNSVGTHVRLVTPTGQDSNDGEMKDTKTHRPKERRRRGKDPSKELLKATKKLRGLGKSNPSAESEGDGTSYPHGSTQTPDDLPQSSSTSGSMTISSASQLHEIEARVGSSSTPTAPSPSMPNPESALHVVDSECTRQDAQLVAVSTDPREISSQIHNLEDSIISLSSNNSNGSSTCTSSSASETTSEPAITPSTSPSLSLSENIPLNPAHLHASEPQTIYSTPHIGPSHASTSYNHSTKQSNPWDWEGVPQVPAPEVMYRKPPRFHSQARGSGSPAPVIPGPSSSYPFPCPDSPSSTLHPPSSANNNSTLFIFPTLDGPPSASINGSSSSGSGCTGNGMNTAINGNTPLSTRHIPHRTPTPSAGTNTPPPSLSTQTQIASLRGALEAARLREEKMKLEIERLGKELEMIRWESITSRRREAELQNQLHHTTLQLETYVGIYSSASSQGAPSQAHTPAYSNGSNTGGDNGTGPSTLTPAAHPSPHVPQSPLPAPLTGIQLSAQALFPNGLLSPAPLASPVALPGSMGRPSSSASSSLPHTPYFGYSPHHPNANLFSLFYPMGFGMNHHFHGSANSRPGSVAGSSVGSLSPDLAGPSSPRLSLLLDRSKRRMKVRRLNGINTKSPGGWEEGADGWIVNNDEKDHDEDDLEEEETELSEMLADAILKRPGSMRIKCVKKKPSQLKDQSDVPGKGVTEKPGVASSPSEAQPEFVFPSLSNLGNVHYTERCHNQTEEDRERETAIAELAASVAATMQAATVIEEHSTRPPGITSEEWPNADTKDLDEHDINSNFPQTSTPQEADNLPSHSTNDNDLVISKAPVLPQNSNVQPPVSN